MVETLSYREHVYRSADDRLTLFARDYPMQDGTETQAVTPLLLMHGLTRNSADFEPLIGQLGAGRRMIVPDQRGRGRSDYDPDPNQYRPDVYVEDMWALLDGLGIDRAILIGTSMGGLMAMLMGTQQPERVAGIVLNDVGPVVSEAGLARIRSYVGDGKTMTDWEDAAQRCEAVNGSALPDLEPEDWIAFAHRTCTQLPDGRVQFAYDPAIADGMAQEDTAAVPPDLWPVWKTLAAIPMLVLRGAHSDILNAEVVREMERLHTAHFTASDIPDRGHAPLLDEQIAVEQITEFLRSCC